MSLRKSITPVIVPLLLLCLADLSTPRAQSTAASSKPTPFGVVRLRARPKVGGAEKKLARKRFFLIKGSLEDNKGLIEAMNNRPWLSRDCYYRSKGASCALINWLKVNDCESVYCRAIDPKADLQGQNAVPEFQAAYNQGKVEFREANFGRLNLPLEWITDNLPEWARTGFYKQKQEAVASLIRQAEERSKSKVLSVMTDRNGTAYFTEIEPGTYIISNIIPSETEKGSILLNCEVKVQPVDLGREKPFTMNQANKRCAIVEKPPDTCEKSQPCK